MIRSPEFGAAAGKRMKMAKFLDEKAWKFAVVGVINTVVGSGVMFGLYNLAGCSYWVSSAANYFLTSILSYFLNKHFTFQYKGDLAGSALRFAVNIGICYFVAYGLAKPAVAFLLKDVSVTAQENVSMLAGMCLFVGANYLGQRLFAFRKRQDN